MMNINKILLAAACTGFILFIGCKYQKVVQLNTVTPIDSSKYTGGVFKENIRPTEARTPDSERIGFRLPPGFEVQLYASEPDIGKPINITFDAKGRMWVTQSFEYPFPAQGKGKDRLTILEDTNGDGKADRFTHFDDTLNIPIGILPLNDGAVAYSIPNVYRFTDANNDGKPDKEKKLLGPFEYKDTHGMVNNFIRGYDGWIHACHGFTNKSTVAGADGDSITMISGNTFRFRPDGSRVEHETYGRINPFGLAYDELGYLYSTDCHTSPLYQLIRGGDYLQWGKEEGMGFAPDMKPLENEATALAGLAYYADVKFPAEYQKNFYIGDAVASRVYRNSYVFKGSSPVGKKEADFILSEDPWFRPVDVKLGPDGALYVADFYNSIIGHYEVPLDHPKRDKIRGRIWRITYKGEHNQVKDLTTASLNELLTSLNADNLPVRMFAADQLTDRIGEPAVVPLKEVLNKKNISTRNYVHALWVLQRLNALTDDIITKSATNSNAVIRLHTMRVLAEQKPGEAFHPLILNALNDKDPHVKRAAVELLTKYLNSNSVQSALAVRREIPDYDSHLIYTTRLCLRNLARNDDIIKQVNAQDWKQDDAAYLADVMTGVYSAEAANFLYNYVKKYPLSNTQLPKAFQHITRFIPADQIDNVINTAAQKRGNDVDLDFSVFKGLRLGLEQRGESENVQLAKWGEQLAQNYLTKYPAGNPMEKTEEMLSQQKFAVDLAGNYKVRSLEEKLKAFAEEPTNLDIKNPDWNTSLKINAALELKTAALKALLKIDTKKNAELAGSILTNNSTLPEFKNRIANMLGDFPQSPEVMNVLGSINDAPPNLQDAIVRSLASSPTGKDVILKKVRQGEIFARTLIEPKVEERILLNISPKQKQDFDELTSNLAPVSKEKQELINDRLKAFASYNKSIPLDSGHTVFIQNCSPCHSIANQGGKIGPNLDGVGKWDSKALTEKIIDPNRNISEAFRNYTIKLKDGRVMTGLYRREEGNVTVFADMAGQEFSVAKKDIAERTASKYTLMPDHFGNVLSQQQFNALLQYLLNHKS